MNKALPLPLDALPFLDPLKLLLNTLGISVEHLVEGLRKCVNELTPEASDAVKKLLVTTACGANLVNGQGLPTLSALPLQPTPTRPVLICDPVFPHRGLYPHTFSLSWNLRASAVSSILEGIFE